MGLGWIADSGVIVVLTHVARFGAVGVLAAAWVARSEGWELAALRSLDGATGVVGWMKTVPPASWAALVGAGVAMGLLSLHEIESAVIVHPVGMEVLSRHLLSLLHFSRDEDLSAAAVWLIGLGLIPAASSGALLVGGLATRRGWMQPGAKGSERGVGIEPRPRGRR
jgi:ABC-type Fe3+ transport system permease subunit